MRHRRRGRKLGRHPNHQRALLRNLASALFLTEQDAEFDDNAPKIKGRITTTVAKAKEVRPLVEKCITIACRSLASTETAREFESSADRDSHEWKTWRKSDRWQQWASARATGVAARRRCIRLLGDKAAVELLFDEVAPRFVDRPGGYTRVVRLAQPRLGDAGTQAILEFVGVRDRVIEHSARPAFEDDDLSDGDLSDSDLSDGDQAESEEVAQAEDAKTAEAKDAEAQDEPDEDPDTKDKK